MADPAAPAFPPELTVIPLPSNIGINRCSQLVALDLIPQEMSLREGQANDALHNLRVNLSDKAILLRTVVRKAGSQSRSTRAWSQVKSVENKVSLCASIYQKSRKQMIKLGVEDHLMEKYEPLLREHLKVTTAVADPNARGQRNESLAWFWSVDFDSTGPDGDWMNERECYMPSATSISIHCCPWSSEFTGFVRKRTEIDGRKSSPWWSMKWTGHACSSFTSPRYGWTGRTLPRPSAFGVMHVLLLGKLTCIYN